MALLSPVSLPGEARLEDAKGLESRSALAGTCLASAIQLLIADQAARLPRPLEVYPISAEMPRTH